MLAAGVMNYATCALGCDLSNHYPLWIMKKFEEAFDEKAALHVPSQWQRHPTVAHHYVESVLVGA